MSSTCTDKTNHCFRRTNRHSQFGTFNPSKFHEIKYLRDATDLIEAWQQRVPPVSRPSCHHGDVVFKLNASGDTPWPRCQCETKSGTLLGSLCLEFCFVLFIFIDDVDNPAHRVGSDRLKFEVCCTDSSQVDVVLSLH